MNLNRILYILVFLSISTTLTGQNLTPDRKVLMSNKIKELTINNSLDTTLCYYDNFIFNKKGQIIKEFQGKIDIYFEMDYYDNGFYKTYSTKKLVPIDGDSIVKVSHYYYDKNPNLEKIVSYNYYKGKIAKIDTLYYTKGRQEIPKLKYNRKKQIIEQTKSFLYYPCDIFYNGNLKFIYDYYDNGLIKSAKVFNENNKMILDFIYKYKYYK